MVEMEEGRKAPAGRYDTSGEDGPKVIIFLLQTAMSNPPGVLSSAPLLAELSRTVEKNPEDLYSGSSDIQNAALQAAKFVFDLCKLEVNLILLFLSPLLFP